MLEARRALGPDAFVFGRESGRYVASFDKADSGAEIHELKGMMRHADIRATARYLKARDERLRELAGKMAHRTG